MKKRINFLLVFFVIALTVFAQQSLTITGKVVEASTNEAMPGVTVKVEGKTTAAATDINGNYTITAERGDVLTFSFLGMQSFSVTVASDAPIDVQLRDDNILLDQVVVIGYGTIKKSDLTGAVSSIGSKDLMADVATSAAGALQGKVPGVAVTNSAGNPGRGMSITVRGITSLTNNDPLYVIDGVYGDINLIDPSDIQSIEVLKDASAAAIYGSRAASGVVLVTTKSGRKNMPTKLDVNIYAGIQQISKKLDVMNASDWTGFLSSRSDDLAKQIAASPYSQKYGNSGGTNWQDELYRSAAMYKANMNISGGSETSIYSASVGYLSQDGIMDNTGYTSLNVRLKNEFSFLNDKLKIGESLIFKSSKRNGADDHSTVQDALRMPSVVPVHDEDIDFGWGGVEDWMNNLGNPVGWMNVSNFTYKTMDLLFNAYAQVELFDGLRYKLNFGLNQTQLNDKEYTGAYDFRRSDNKLPDLWEKNNHKKTWLLENTLNYDKTFGKHTVSGLLGYSAQRNSERYITAQRLDLPFGTNSINAGPSDQASNSGEYFRSGLASVFGRAMYSYDSRYMLSASIRRDGSSKFADGHRWGSFPSFSAGWNIHNESFASGIRNVVDELKLRASYGKLGNQNIKDYTTQRGISTGMNYVQGSQWWMGGITGNKWVSPENLTWETTETYNIGLDATFLGGKLALSADAFMQQTKDVLMPVSMPGSAGMTGNPIMNAGTIENKGFEMAVTHRNHIGRVYYSLTGNMSTVSNKVKKITVGNEQELEGYNPQGLGTVTWFKVGEPMGVFRVIKTDGIFQSRAEIDAHRDKDGSQIQPDAEPGDIRFVDYNGDGVINDNDRQTVGKPIPDVAFGFRANVEWNGFDANLFFDGMIGNSLYNFPRYRTEGMLVLENYSKDVLGAWTAANPSNSMPRWARGLPDPNDPTGEKKKTDPNNNARANSDRWIEKGDFLRLKTLEIGYTLPKSITQKISLERVRFYTLFDNLFTITGYKGYTPDLGYNDNNSAYEALSRGADHGRYPLARSFSFGIQIGL